MCNKLMIIGAGGHGKVVANIAKLNGYKEIYFLDDDVLKKYIGKYQIIGTTKDIDKYKEEYDFFVAIGNNDIRKNISLKLSNFPFQSFPITKISALYCKQYCLLSSSDSSQNTISTYFIDSTILIRSSCV